MSRCTLDEQHCERGDRGEDIKREMRAERGNRSKKKSIKKSKEWCSKTALETFRSTDTLRPTSGPNVEGPEDGMQIFRTT